MADEDPDLAAFRAKLKQGGGMSRGDRDTWKRARPMVVGLLLGAGALGAVKVATMRRDAQQAAATAKEDAERRAKLDADHAVEAAFDAKFAAIAAEVKDLDVAALGRATPSLVAGRKVLGLDAKATSVFERDKQGAGGVFAGSAAEVGVVVRVTFEMMEDHPVKYEGGAVLIPTRKTFTAIAWPEKKVVATWTEIWAPPSSVLVRRVGKYEMPMELGPSGMRWKADAEQLAAGTAPTSTRE